MGVLFLYVENHALDAWFQKAYGDEVERKTPFSYNELAVRQLQNYKKREVHNNGY